MTETGLLPNLTPGARITETAAGTWRLEIPAGSAGAYRLAQLDDYAGLPRGRFAHHPPLTLSLEARASTPDLAGTWGFGLWNDPFSFSLGLGGGARHLPALPNAAWFFFASEQNYLSLRDDLPAAGGLAGVFASTSIPALLLAPGMALFPLMLFAPLARALRGLLRCFIRQAASSLNVAVQDWHTYQIHWQTSGLVFKVDEQVVLETSLVPAAPLGLVIWIDNQYAAFPPAGRPGFGTLPTPQPAWIEVRSLILDGAPQTPARPV